MKLKGHRTEQLLLLKRRGAVSRETAVCVSLNGGDELATPRPGTLSAMIGEGLTMQAQLPYRGDSKRRLSHYWLTEAGLQAVAQ